jgi:putative hemolysin
MILPPLLVTYVSDVFPKVIGSLNNTRIAPLIALPVAALVNALWPVTRLLDKTIMRPAHRLVGERHEHALFSTDELQELLEMSQQQGVIDVSENQLLQEVVRIADLKVRDVMTPRVDMVAFNLGGGGAGGGAEALLALFRKSHLAKIPVYEGPIDNIIGLIYAKTLLLEMGATGGDLKKIDLRKLVQPVRFVPEQQTLERLLVHLRQTKTQLAIVVDEFGGLAGVVALEDVVEQMVGDIQEAHDAPSRVVQRVGDDEFLVPGDLSVADWMDAFGAKIEATHTTTVAGLLAASLKRLPKEGDQVRLAHLSMRVDSMRGRRVDRVRLKLLANGPNGPTGHAAPGGGA